MQKHLKGRLSTSGAAYARFLYAWPLALVYVWGLNSLGGLGFPAPNWLFLLYCLLGGLTQILFAVLLLWMFSFRSFAVGTTFSKLEVVMVAGLGAAILGDGLGLLAVLAIAISAVGVVCLSMDQTKLTPGALLAGLAEKPTLIGLLCAACLGASVVFFRGGALSLGHDNVAMAAGYTFAISVVLQTLMMGVYIRWREPGEITRVMRHWRWAAPVGVAGALRDGGAARWYGAASALFVLAMLAKPSAVVVPALAWLMDVGMFRRPWRQSLRPVGPWLLAALALVLVTKAQQPDFVVQAGVPAAQRPVVALDALGFYLSKVILPVQLLPDYGRTPARVLEGGFSWIWLLPLALLAVLAVWRRDLRRSVPALWFAAVLAPVLGLIPFEYQNISTVADRYVYLAMLGPALAAAFVLAARPARGLLVAAGVLVVVLGVAAHRQSSFWRSTEVLFERTLAHNPRSFTAHNNLGNALAKSGRYEEAVGHFTETVQLSPAYFRGWTNRGNSLQKLGRLEEAVADFREALRLMPAFVDARIHLARALDGLGRSDEAAREFQLALQGSPEIAETHNAAGVRFFESGDPAVAESHFRQALQLRPTYAEAHNNLANCLVRLGRVPEAVPHYREAIRIDPDYFSAHLNLGKVLFRPDPAGALPHLERALELGGPDPELERRIQALRAALP